MGNSSPNKGNKKSVYENIFKIKLFSSYILKSIMLLETTSSEQPTSRHSSENIRL